MRHFKKSGWRRESHTDGSLTKISLTQHQILLQVKLHLNVNTFNVIMLNMKISMYQCLLFFSSYDGISAAFVFLFQFPIMPPATSQCISLHNDTLPLSQRLITPQNLPHGLLALEAWPVAFSFLDGGKNSKLSVCI